MSCLNVLRVTLVVGNTDNDEVINVSPQELNDAVMMLKDVVKYVVWIQYLLNIYNLQVENYIICMLFVLLGF